MKHYRDEFSCGYWEEEFSKDIRSILNNVCPYISNGLVTFMAELKCKKDRDDFGIIIFECDRKKSYLNDDFWSHEFIKKIEERRIVPESFSDSLFSDSLLEKQKQLTEYFTTDPSRPENRAVTFSEEKIYPMLEAFLETIYKNKKILFSDIAQQDDHFAVFSIAIDDQLYRENIEIGSFTNPYLSPDDYNSFIAQVIEIELAKWKEKFELNVHSFATIDYIMSENAILQLAARDITEGRGLPSHLLFNVLSSMPYEGSPCFGQIAFVLKNSDIDINKINTIEFAEAIDFSDDNLRYIRKLLEITGEGFYLLSVDNLITGICEISNTKDMHILKFNGSMSWTLYYGDKQMVTYEKERLFYKTNSNKAKLKEKKFSPKLEELILKLCEQKHGTAIIIFDKPISAENETERLASFNRGIKLSHPYDLSDNKDHALNFSTIDGAIIIDKMCICYGIGMILDGEASIRGDRSRGARFNSIRNYTNGWMKKTTDIEKDGCIGVVISEDGMVDIT